MSLIKLAKDNSFAQRHPYITGGVALAGGLAAVAAGCVAFLGNSNFTRASPYSKSTSIVCTNVIAIRKMHESRKKLLLRNSVDKLSFDSGRLLPYPLLV